MLNIENNIDPKSAGKKPPTENPGTKSAVSPKSTAFIISIKSPRVKMFIGRVINIIIGLIKVFTRVIATTATKTTSTPIDNKIQGNIL